MNNKVRFNARLVIMFMITQEKMNFFDLNPNIAKKAVSERTVIRRPPKISIKDLMNLLLFLIEMNDDQSDDDAYDQPKKDEDNNPPDDRYSQPS